MNGDWQSFQPTRDGAKANGGTPAEFVAAWRHVVDHLRAAGVDNIKWVFNPTVDTYAETTHVSDIWPGAGYVDVLGLDGFNWGEDPMWGEWRPFTAIFAKQYRRLTRLHPTAPVWICEVGSKEPRRDDGAPRDRRQSKARWITDMMSARAFPRIDTVIWFNEAKERDWRIESSRGSLRAMRRALR
jgi:beta-mannanase